MNLAGAIDDPTDGSVVIAGKEIAGLTDNGKADLRNRTVGLIDFGYIYYKCFDTLLQGKHIS